MAEAWLGEPRGVPTFGVVEGMVIRRTPRGSPYSVTPQCPVSGVRQSRDGLRSAGDVLVILPVAQHLKTAVSWQTKIRVFGKNQPILRVTSN